MPRNIVFFSKHTVELNAYIILLCEVENQCFDAANFQLNEDSCTYERAHILQVPCLLDNYL